MKASEKKKIIKEAVLTQGMEKQIQHFHEEIGELMTSISHLRRGRCDTDQLIVELVDARMMIDAIQEAFGVDPDRYEEIENQQWAKFKSQMAERAKND